MKLHKAQLEQIRREVKAEMPSVVSSMDAATQEYIYNLAFGNKLLSSRMVMLENQINILLDWHNDELKRIRKDVTGKTQFFQKFKMLDKNTPEIVNLPQGLDKKNKPEIKGLDS